jgi:capsular polysaccharide biosynthesis protein
MLPALTTKECPMNLIDYGRIILRRGWIAILLAVVAAVAAYAFSQVVTPIYRGTQTILLVPSRSDNGLTLATVQLLNNRRTYLASSLRAQEIIDNLSLDYTAGYLLEQATIAPNRDNITIQIDVDLPANSIGEAQALLIPIVSEWGQLLIDYQNEQNQAARQEDRIKAEVQDNVQVYQLQPNERIYTLIGGIAGFFLGIVLIFILEYLESNVIRRREDIEKALGINVLAAVPAE